MKMLKRLLLVSLLACCALTTAVVATTTTLIRDYTYSAGENDSRVSARRAALQQLQVLVIEEVGVQVQSSFSQQTSMDREDFNRQVQSNYQSFAQALTRTRIIEERWDGETFYLKAEIEVDPNGIRQQMALLAPAGEPQAMTCEARKAQVVQVLRRVGSPDKNLELIRISKDAPFDVDCNDWQYSILESLYFSEYPMPDYRDFLFAQLADLPPHELQFFLPAMIRLTLSRADFTEREWQQLLPALQKNRSQRFKTSLTALSNQTRSQGRQSDNARWHYQEPEQLQVQLQALLALAQNGQLAEPALEAGDFARQAHDVLAVRQPELANQWLAQQAAIIQDPAGLIKTLLSQLNQRNVPPSLDSPAGRNLLLLMPRLAESSDESLKSAQLPWSFMQLLRSWDATPEGHRAIARLRDAEGQNLARVLNLLELQNIERERLFVRHQLPDSQACQPADCARALFSESNAEVYAASQLLLDYGVRAREQEPQVIRKLERLMAGQSRGSEMVRTKQNLIQLLAVLKTRDSQAHALLIKGLEDLDHEVPDYSRDALVALYPRVIGPIMDAWPQQSPLVQRRLVQVFGKMPRDPIIRNYLHQIVPTDDTLRFALEDALLAQDR